MSITDRDDLGVDLDTLAEQILECLVAARTATMPEGKWHMTNALPMAAAKAVDPLHEALRILVGVERADWMVREGAFRSAEEWAHGL